MKKDIQIRFRVSERENEIIKLEEKKYKNRSEFFRMLLCKCQYKNAQKVENKNVHFPRAIPQLELP